MTSSPVTHSAPLACPYLGLTADPGSHYAYSQEAHRCYTPGADSAQPIDLEHQGAYCLAAGHTACPRYVPLPGQAASSAVLGNSLPLASAPPGPWRALLWVFSGLVLVVGLVYYALNGLFSPNPVPPGPAMSGVTPSAATATRTPRPQPIASPAPSPAPSPTLDASLRTVTLSPAGKQEGWVVSDEPVGNHFGDSYLNAGIFADKVYYSVLQFDVAKIPRGSAVRSARLRLVGLRDGQLGTGGTWQVRWLAPQAAGDWSQHSYQSIAQTPYQETLAPALAPGDLATGRENNFAFSPAQLQKLTEAIARQQPLILRLDGPASGANSLFAWDSGYGPASNNALPRLILTITLPEAALSPEEYVIVTSAPAPENVFTAVALSSQMTAEATRLGTPTPLPWFVVTATPLPTSLISTPSPTPQNQATADYLAAVATARALTTGTPTPTPPIMVTATPTRTPTPTPSPLPLVAITSTPTPLNIFTAQAMSLQATAQAQAQGTATPEPKNWATPMVVTSTPLPQNSATLVYRQAVAMAQALTTGTPTPLPGNVVTATPTPIFIPLDDQLPTPLPTCTPIPTPAPLPGELVGKIAFLSDRATLANDPRAKPLSNPLVYVINPDGTGLALLTNRWPYDQAIRRDRLSADQRFRAFVKDADRYPALFFYDYLYQAERQVTMFRKSIAYDPAWSPAADRIAFVSNDTENDEIWVIGSDGSDGCQLTRDDLNWWDKHPSWSPDGKEIVFWSNRTGVREIWIMNADGGNQHSLSRSGFNDWDPVWIKYTDPPQYADEQLGILPESKK